VVKGKAIFWPADRILQIITVGRNQKSNVGVISILKRKKHYEKHKSSSSSKWLLQERFLQ
jgi:hypothetical protein